MSAALKLPAAPAIAVGPLLLDPETSVLSGENGHVRLSRNAFRVIERLFRRPGVIVSKGALIEALYDDGESEPDCAENVVRVTISRLRGVLELLGGDGVTIKSEPGIGYHVVVRTR